MIMMNMIIINDEPEKMMKHKEHMRMIENDKNNDNEDTAPHDKHAENERMMKHETNTLKKCI